MPRTKWLMSEEQKTSRALLSALYGAMGVNDLTIEVVAGRIGMSKNTLYARMHDPDKFTRGELRKLCRVLDIPVDEMRKMAI